MQVITANQIKSVLSVEILLLKFRSSLLVSKSENLLILRRLAVR